MLRKVLFLVVLFPLILFAQGKEIDTLLLDKMIIASIEPNTYIGLKIDENCSLVDKRVYKSPHKEAPNMAYITDYVLCNNGNVNMFFEVYDGSNFAYVSNDKVSFNNDVDSDNIKVLLSKRTTEEKQFLKSNINKLIEFANNYFEEERQKEMDDELNDAMKPFLHVEKYGLGFIQYNPVEEYSSTGAYFKIFNPSKKTIKYIWFTVAGENAVNDLVKTNTGGFYKTLKGIGPIKSYGIASWEFDHVWLTDIVEFLRISTIKIQYMDGSVKTLKYNEKMYLGEDVNNRLRKALDNIEVNEKDKKNTYYSNANPTEIYSNVEQTAEFPGGTSNFKKKIIENFRIEAVKGTGKMTTEVTFVIERDGSITNVKAIGNNIDFNNEAERAVKSVQNKWISAKINGVPVRYKMKIPLTLSFD